MQIWGGLKRFIFSRFIVDKVVKIFFWSLSIVAVFPLFGGLPIKVKAPFALLYDVENEKVLYNKRGRVKAFPASTTKIGVVLYALELLGDGDLEQLIYAPPECLKRMEKRVKIENEYKVAPYLLESDGISFGILPGERLPLRTLLLGAFNNSANDAANVIAHHFGGTIDAFVEGLNLYFKEIDCHDTHYDNPHGLHFPTHMTTCYDLARMAKEARRFPLIYEMATTQEYERPKTDKRPAMTYTCPNLLLNKTSSLYYPHATGLKTGYIEDAGFCLVATAKSDERDLIAVVLKEEDKKQRFRDVITMFNIAFQEEKTTRRLYNKEETLLFRNVKRGNRRLRARLTQDVEISYFPSAEPKISYETHFGALKAPIKKGAEVGRIVVKNERGDVIACAPLIASERVDEKFLFKIAHFCSIRGLVGVLILVCALLIWRYKRWQIQQILRSENLRSMRAFLSRGVKRVISLRSNMR